MIYFGDRISPEDLEEVVLFHKTSRLPLTACLDGAKIKAHKNYEFFRTYHDVQHEFKGRGYTK